MSMSSFLDFAVLFSYSMCCVSELSSVIMLVLSVLLGTRVSFCSRQLHENPAVVLGLSYLLVCREALRSGLFCIHLLLVVV